MGSKTVDHSDHFTIYRTIRREWKTKVVSLFKVPTRYFSNLSYFHLAFCSLFFRSYERISISKTGISCAMEWFAYLFALARWQFFSVQNFHDMTIDFQCINIFHFFVKHISIFTFLLKALLYKKKLLFPLELKEQTLLTTVDELVYCIYSYKW